MPQLLLSDFVIMAPALDFHPLPVSMGCCSRAEAAGDWLIEAAGQLLNEVTNA
jgi:hypothetical protein